VVSRTRAAGRATSTDRRRAKDVSETLQLYACTDANPASQTDPDGHIAASSSDVTVARTGGAITPPEIASREHGLRLGGL